MSLRKIESLSDKDEIMPAQFDGTYRMVTELFSSPSEEWKATASQIAEQLGHR